MAKSISEIGPPPGSAPAPKAKAERPLRRRLQMDIPSPRQVKDNLTEPSDDLANLNFKVSERFHRAFKSEASLRGMQMKDLLEASFKAFLDANGSANNRDNFGEK